MIERSLGEMIDRGLGLGPEAGVIARRKEGKTGQEIIRNELMRRGEIAETTLRMVILFFFRRNLTVLDQKSQKKEDSVTKDEVVNARVGILDRIKKRTAPVE